MTEVEDIEGRLSAGEWLRPGEVAALVGASRSTVHRWLAEGRLRYRSRPFSGHRTCDPQDVRTLLAESRREHGGEPAGDG